MIVNYLDSQFNPTEPNKAVLVKVLHDDGRIVFGVPNKSTYANWDEAKHPRHPAGDERGGEFAPSDSDLEGAVEPTTAPRSMLEWPGGTDTLTEHTVNGKLTPERQALHDRLVAEAVEGYEPKEEPVAYLMGGGPASGKSVMQDMLGVVKNRLTVDVDQIRQKLPEWDKELAAAKAEGRKPNTYLGLYTHEEASLISKRIIDEAVKRKLDYMLDGAGDSTIDKLEANIKRYKKGGAKVYANYITVDYDEAYRRMIKRAEKNGRYVPASHLRAIHAEVSRVFPEAIKRGLYDKFTLWDNTDTKPLGGGMFTAPLKVVSGEGTKMVVHNRRAWRRFLAKGQGINPRPGEIS